MTLTDREERIIWSSEARMLRAERDIYKAELRRLSVASRKLLIALETAESVTDLMGCAKRLREAIRKADSADIMTVSIVFCPVHFGSAEPCQKCRNED